VVESLCVLMNCRARNSRMSPVAPEPRSGATTARAPPTTPLPLHVTARCGKREDPVSG
jgi:hypothetical protein